MTPISPLTLAQVIARNIVPFVGVLFFGWPAGNVLLLYFLDTLLAMAVILAGFLSTVAVKDDGVATRINGELGAIFMGLLAAVLVFSIPLGVPLIFVLGPSGFDWRAALADPGLRGGALMQALAAVWSYVELWRALRTHDADQLRLKRRFALVFLRWLAVLMVIFTGVAVLAGPLLIIAAYIVVTIWAEVAPDRFLRAMPGGAEDADPEPGNIAARPAAPLDQESVQRANLRHQRRH
jgi:Family of unknown function (DUF6498)